MHKFKASQIIYFPIKRFFDIFISFLGIVILGVFMIIFAIITKCSSKGPILYKQKRLGKHKKVFTLLKFRSMKVDAPAVAPSEITPETQKAMSTGWGRFMRKTSIDELPQLFNIFVGQMSIIGPRPGQTEDVEGELVKARESFTPNAYDVRPGLGGLAQFKMNRDHDPMTKAKFDSEYVEKISIWLDFKIFILTVLHIFGVGKGR